MLGFVVLRLDKLSAIPSLLNDTCLASLHLSTIVTLTVGMNKAARCATTPTYYDSNMPSLLYHPMPTEHAAQ
jgi:hypothetical protein